MAFWVSVAEELVVALAHMVAAVVAAWVAPAVVVVDEISAVVLGTVAVAHIGLAAAAGNPYSRGRVAVTAAVESCFESQLVAAD